jgi:adenine C2-methylase RlmN of 23S rRNA A2503 and tRNA A37
LKPIDAWLSDVVKRAGFADAVEFARAFDLKPYRLRQLYHAATKELLDGVSEVTTLPKELRTSFEERGIAFSAIEPISIQHSRDGQTTKGLFRLHDGKEVEAVLMEHYGDRTTVCISSQAGCAFACTFCATGQGGFNRNLSAGEIFDQAWYFARALAPRGKRITNVVFMGMGEPFHNYDAVMDAVSRSRRSGSWIRSTPSPRSGSRLTSQSHCTRRPTSFARSSCRSTGASRWKPSWRPANGTSQRPGARFSSST